MPKLINRRKRNRSARL